MADKDAIDVDDVVAQIEQEKKLWKLSSVQQEEDHSKATEEALATAKSLFNDGTGTLDPALELLLNMEKTTRLGGDTLSTLKLCREIIQMLVKHGNLDLLMDTVEVLIKKRSQMKQVQGVLVKEAMKALNKDMSEDDKLKTIKRLRAVCEGKIHVELEFARLTVQQAAILCKNGQDKEASDMLQDLQVDTIGNMDRIEKLDIILLQVERAIQIEEFVVAAIVAKKITIASLNKDDSVPQRIRYYLLMLRYHSHTKDFFQMADCYARIYETVFADKYDDNIADGRYSTHEAKLAVLANVIVFLLLASSLDRSQTVKPDNMEGITTQRALERQTLLTKYYNEKRTSEIPQLKEIIKTFTGKGLITWDKFAADFGATMSAMPPFQDTTLAAQRHEELRFRVVEHNILVCSKFVSNISLVRLSELVGVALDEAENTLCTMVTTKQVWAKIDRIAGVVQFARPKDKIEVVNEWRSNVSSVLDLLEQTCHLVGKEHMIHGAKSKGK